MNRNNIIGIALVAVAAGLIALMTTEVGDLAARCVGKAAWYLPYVAVVGAVRAFRKVGTSVSPRM